MRKAVLAMAGAPVYAGFGPTLLAEHAARELGRGSEFGHGAPLADAGRAVDAQAQASEAPAPSAAAGALGELVQWDSSVHA